MSATPPRLESLLERPWFAPAAVGLGWLLLGAVAGLEGAFVSGRGARQGAAWRPLLAGALWVPITVGVAWLARRVRWGGRRPSRFLAVHVPLSLTTSFVLNAAFSLLLVAWGSLAWPEAQAMAWRQAVRWFHLNTAGYWAIVLAVHALDRRAAAAPADEPPGPPALELSSPRGNVLVPLHEIAWIEADGDYARVHAGGRSYLLSKRMKALESELGRWGFIRVHRSAIVNGSRVREVRHRTHGDYDAEMSDGTVVRVSRGRRQALDHLFPRRPSPPRPL